MRVRALIGAVVAYSTMVVAALAQGHPSTCTGKDLLAELRKNSPDAYKTFEDEAARVPNMEGLLWRIDRSGRKPSYLFGTAHITDERVTKFPPEFNQAFAESSVLALELESVGDREGSIKRIRRLYSAARNLSTAAPLTNFTPEERRQIVLALKARGMPTESIQTFKPWFLAMSLALTPCETSRQMKGIETVDEKIASMARRRGMPVIGLETDIEQINALVGLEPWVFDDMLRDGSRSEERNADLSEFLTRLYLDRKIGGITAGIRQLMLPEESIKSYLAFTRTLIGPRNQVMRDRARPLLEKGGVFIAVGALHLPFEDGLVELFRKDGYEVTRVW